MALVAMVNLRVDAQISQGPDTSDTKEQLLLQAVFPVTTIKVIGHLTVLRNVSLIVSVEKIEVGAADGHLPDPGGDISSREGHTGGHPVAVLVKDRLCGNLCEILGVVLCDLLTLAGQDLGEIAVPVEEANRHKVDIHVTGLLKVVASENSKTT